jgi:signal transduction histidine kinase
VPFSIKTKQVAGVTAVVAVAVILITGWYLSSLVRVRLEEIQARAELLANIIYQRYFVLVSSGADPREGLNGDPGLASILDSAAYSDVLVYAAIVDKDGTVIARSQSYPDPPPATTDFATLLQHGPIAQTRVINTPGGRLFEWRKQLFLDKAEFGTIRIGVSTSLIATEFSKQLKTPLYTAIGAILIAILVSTLLAQVVLRPIHVIRSGLARLGRGELDVNVDLPKEGELAGLQDSFKAVTARLAADQSQLAGQRATLESIVEHLEDAVALFSGDGVLLFANPAMQATLTDAAGSPRGLLPADHPYRVILDETLNKHTAQGPRAVKVPELGERLLLTHVVTDQSFKLTGVLLVSRNLAYLSHVESTLSYSRKLAALSRLSSGIAHEVKNPLNATMIHLELLKMQLADVPAAAEHLKVIAAQVRRLDEVVQGFLKFIRPEDLKLQPTPLAPLLEDLMPIVRAEADASNIDVRVECPPDLPPVSADPALLSQALLNLALNACQAMPNGGKLRIAAAPRAGQRIEILFEDTGVGIPPESLGRIFDLYFTTKEHGSGIGLSMVYRTVQLHDGEIDVESVPGRGTTFFVRLRQA